MKIVTILPPKFLTNWTAHLRKILVVSEAANFFHPAHKYTPKKANTSRHIVELWRSWIWKNLLNMRCTPWDAIYDVKVDLNNFRISDICMFQTAHFFLEISYH